MPDIKEIARSVMLADLKTMDLSDAKPIDKPYEIAAVSPGDRFRMTMQGLGGKELYLIEIVRHWDA